MNSRDQLVCPLYLLGHSGDGFGQIQCISCTGASGLDMLLHLCQRARSARTVGLALHDGRRSRKIQLVECRNFIVLFAVTQCMYVRSADRLSCHDTMYVSLAIVASAYMEVTPNNSYKQSHTASQQNLQNQVWLRYLQVTRLSLKFANLHCSLT